MGWDFEENTNVTWTKFGALYTLSYTFYAYDDPEDRVAGSGVRGLALTITKGKHEFGEIDVDTLSKKHQKELYADAEEDSGKFSEE